MNGVKFTLEAKTDGVGLAESVSIRSDDARGQQCLFHFNRLMRKAVAENDYRSIFRSLGMLSDSEVEKLFN